MYSVSVRKIEDWEFIFSTAFILEKKRKKNESLFITVFVAEKRQRRALIFYNY
jgi:hypothetical protein